MKTLFFSEINEYSDREENSWETGWKIIRVYKIQENSILLVAHITSRSDIDTLKLIKSYTQHSDQTKIIKIE